MAHSWHTLGESSICKTLSNPDLPPARFPGQADKKAKAAEEGQRNDELKKFLNRKREYEASVQNMRETKFRQSEEKSAHKIG